MISVSSLVNDIHAKIKVFIDSLKPFHEIESYNLTNYQTFQILIWGHSGYIRSSHAKIMLKSGHQKNDEIVAIVCIMLITLL